MVHAQRGKCVIPLLVCVFAIKRVVASALWGFDVMLMKTPVPVASVCAMTVAAVVARRDRIARAIQARQRVANAPVIQRALERAHKTLSAMRILRRRPVGFVNLLNAVAVWREAVATLLAGFVFAIRNVVVAVRLGKRVILK